jgi:hypothetical protein
MRATLADSPGAVVLGMLIQMPGSRWRAPLVSRSAICWR